MIPERVNPRSPWAQPIETDSRLEPEQVLETIQDHGHPLKVLDGGGGSKSREAHPEQSAGAENEAPGQRDGAGWVKLKPEPFLVPEQESRLAECAGLGGWVRPIG